MNQEGFKNSEIEFEQIAYIRYGGQLEDVEVSSPVSRIESQEYLDKLLNAFEDKYTRVYGHGVRYPEAGFQIYEVGLRASVPKPKPKLKKYRLEGKDPSPDAYKGERDVYHKGEWSPVRLYEMDSLQPGNEVEGSAIIEAPATTLPVPGGKKIVVDEYKRFWIKEV
jgi:acetone carboxylase beta subunit